MYTSLPVYMPKTQYVVGSNPTEGSLESCPWCMILSSPYLLCHMYMRISMSHNSLGCEHMYMFNVHVHVGCVGRVG